MSKFYSLFSFAAGLSVGAFSGFDNPYAYAAIIASFMGGWLFCNTAHNVSLNVATRLLASSFGKRAMLEVIADGIAKLEIQR